MDMSWDLDSSLLDFPVPVLCVWLQACDKVTRHWLQIDGLVVQGDDVGADVRPIAVWLLPLQE